MTPQQKAKQLIELFWTEVEDNNYATRKMSLIQANKCALIAVSEIISVIDPETFLLNWLYWKEVKKELEKL